MTASRKRGFQGRLALRFFAGVCAALAIPVILVEQFPAAPAVDFFWDFANMLGYLGLACCLLLFVYAGRPHSDPPFSGRFFSNLHRHLGYVALLLVLAHIAVLLIREPLLLEHLEITAPLYMLAGLAASLLLLFLVVSSIPVWRRLIWSDYRRFKFLHAWLAVGFVAFAAWHVIGSGFYLNTELKVGLAGLAILALAVYFWRGRKRLANTAGNNGRLPHTAVYSYRIVYGSLLLLLFAAVLLSILKLPAA